MFQYHTSRLKPPPAYGPAGGWIDQESVPGMPIEVDQSNRIERTNKDTFLALSNDLQWAIVIPAKVKRAAIARLKGHRRRGTVYARLFAAGLFILLRPHLKTIVKRREQIVIDTEYIGYEGDIKGMLLRHAHSVGIRLHKDAISFAQVGKSSGAHQAAWQAQRGKRAPDHCVSEEELMGLAK